MNLLRKISEEMPTNEAQARIWSGIKGMLYEYDRHVDDVAQIAASLSDDMYKLSNAVAENRDDYVKPGLNNYGEAMLALEKAQSAAEAVRTSCKNVEKALVMAWEAAGGTKVG